uniref:STAS domain-containing protein n=1 Tax=Parastrongyloides trichosuri TaxID=131310 RepID=A0A0N4Z4J3_PARTI
MEDKFLSEVLNNTKMHPPDIHLCKYDLNHSRKTETKKHSPINILISKLFSFVPIFTWIPRYEIKKNLLSDIISGITTGVLHVPQGIAYAKLTNVAPVNGLYVSFLASFFYMFFGTSRHASMGTSSFICLMAGVTTQMVLDKYDKTNIVAIEPDEEWKYNLTNIQITTASTFTIGIILTLSAFFRFKTITKYMPDSLIKGFTTGAAFHVALSQVDDIMGINIPKFSGLFNAVYKIIALIKEIPSINIYTFSSSIITVIFYYIGDKIITPYIYKKTQKSIPIPYEVITMIIFTVISSILSFESNFNINVVGTIPTDIPKPEVPLFKLVPDLFGNCILITLVTVTVHLSMVKMLATKFKYEDELKSGQEIYALGFTSLLSSFFPVFPNAMAMSRTMVLVNSGGKTQLTNLFSCILLAIVILFLGPYLYNLPMCILSATIMYALRSMFLTVLQLPQMFRESKYDGAIYMVSLVVTIVADLVYGLIVSIIFALFTIIIRTQKPKWSLLFPVSPNLIQPLMLQTNKLNIDKNPELSKIYKDTFLSFQQPLFAVHRFEGSIIFTNAEEFKSSCISSLKELEERKSLKYLEYSDNINVDTILIIDFSRITDIDLVGIKFLKEIISTAQMYHIQIVGCNVNDSVLKTLEITGVTKLKIIFYDNLQKAIASITKSENIKKRNDDHFIIKL